MAVLKIIFDKSEHMKQWGLLLGDTRPEPSLGGKHITELRQEMEKIHDNQLEEKIEEAKDGH